MDNEELELQDSPQPDQETQPESKIEVTLEDYYELERKNKQLYARLKKSEPKAENTNLKSTEPEPEKTRSDEEWKEAMELRVSGYNDKEVEYLMRNGGKKALEDEYTMAAINAKREQSQAEAAAVDTGASAKSDIEKKYTPDQLEEMPIEELEKILPKA